MRRTTVAVLVIVVMSTVVLGCSSSSNKSPSTATPAVNATDSRQFSPGTVSVSVGGTVKWTNTGQLSHTVTFDSGPAFSQDLTSGGAGVSRTFPTAGTFTYHCAIHGPSMHGTIIVK